MPLLEAVIDLTAIDHNVRVMKDKVAPAQLMCIVKANAYNHGMEQVVPTMEDAGADAFGVATLSEAIALRRTGTTKPIAMWIWSPEEELADAVAHRIDVAIPSLEHARVLVDSQLPLRVYVKVETGMHRSGVDERDWEETFALLRDAPQLEVLGLMSHFACADEPANPYNDVQEEEFRRALAVARGMGLECPLNHLANSPASLTRPSALFEQARVGLALYGLEPVPGLDHGLRPAMSWQATVVNVKPYVAGDSASYSLMWTGEKPGYLATVSVGYADGLPRAWQDKLQVGIGGKLYPQVGRVCMDQIVVDLGSEPQAQIGDTATIFGPAGMGADALADAVGTINYEVICRPAGRTQRVYRSAL